MEIRITEHQGFITLAPIGDLDANSSIEMNDAISNCIAKDQVKIHIDCAEMDYISSAGLGVFMSHKEEVDQKNGKIIFSGMSESIYKVFELLGLDRYMAIMDSFEEVKKEMEQ